jgi:hypothetical protein
MGNARYIAIGGRKPINAKAESVAKLPPFETLMLSFGTKLRTPKPAIARTVRMIVILYAVGLAAMAGIAVRYASTRWWHALIIALLWIPFFPLVARWLTGDISAYLPEDTFAADGYGKDEFIWASIYATVMIAVTAAALLWWIVVRVSAEIRRRYVSAAERR